MLIILAPEKLQQEGGEFKASLTHIAVSVAAGVQTLLHTVIQAGWEVLFQSSLLCQNQILGHAGERIFQDKLIWKKVEFIKNRKSPRERIDKSGLLR